MSGKFDPATITRAMASPRWSALVRTGVDLGSIVHWDAGLLRETRVLVPIDVQALYVPAGSTEPMVRIPLSLTSLGDTPEPLPPPLAPGTAREPGVHLHWAPPDALLRGSLGDNGPTNRLKLPPLPDRWVVVRLLVPKGATQANVRTTIIEADTAKAIPADNYPAGAAAAKPAGRAVAPADLTASAGGSLNWVGVYDAVVNRLAFFDPLDDLPSIAPNGVEGDQVSYIVAGWWSQPELDPLDSATTTATLHVRLQQLGWALTDDVEGGDQLNSSRAVTRLKQESIALPVTTRYAAAPATTPPPTGIEAAISPAVRSLATSVFADEVKGVVQAEPTRPRSTLLHGCVFGIPVAGPATVENRPAATQVGIVIGEQGDDIAAALASASLGAQTVDERRATERLLAAFTGHLLDRVGSSDGLIDIEEHEHAGSFVSRDGGPGGTDRLQSGRSAAPLPAGRQARSAAARVANPTRTKGIRITAFSTARSKLGTATLDDQRAVMGQWAGGQPDVEPSTEARDVVRPAPRLYVPAEPMVALRGAGRSLRYGADGRFSQDGLVHCRWPSQVAGSVAHVIDGRSLVPSLGTGSAPPEVQLLVQECATTNPYLAPWIASVASNANGLDPAATRKRMIAEAVLRFGNDAVYDGQTTAFQQSPQGAPIPRRFVPSMTSSLVADQLRRFSLVAGTDPYPVGVTAWSQPWVPLWLEWEVRLDIADRLDGWALGPVDEERDTSLTPATAGRTFRGRSVLTTGTAATLGSAVRDWLAAEDQRDRTNSGEADEATEAALAGIATQIEHLDVLAASLDGIREQLLGFKYDGGLVRLRNSDGTVGAPEKSGDASVFLRAGTLTMTAARLVDTFGRTLDLPIDSIVVPARNEVASAAHDLLLRPRVTAPARLLFRFVDPDPAAAANPAEARVDQVDPTQAVNPVAGFLLPDHIDEALEVFDVDGTPLGQLSHEPFGGGVVWEIAPGRPGPVDAGPLFGLDGATQHVGFFAAGVVAADAKARGGQPAGPDVESALSALLRAIDTTLWTVDTFRAIGGEHIAGLVGRPIAVVRARLTLSVEPDLGLDAATAAAALSDRAFTVRIGELTRADDGLLAYFVEDDYEHVHLVDKIIAALALDSGRQRGQLSTYGTAPAVPQTRPIVHPYVIAHDELTIRANQVVNLTLLMLPQGKVHLTSGVLPRKSLQLARDWVAPGLAVMAPSARIGPVLVDPAQIRLPKISAFPKNQIFTRRDTPQTWKDDPILAATQTALLPDLPHEVQEGYIRIAPDQGEKPQ